MTGTGWYLDQIGMSSFTSPNVQNLNARWQGPIAFYQSNYGIIIMPNDGTGDAGITNPPGSQILLYRVIADATSATGYSIEFLPDGLLTGWQEYIAASGAWFNRITSMLAVSDSVLVLVETGATAVSSGPFGLRTLTRNADNTLTLSAIQITTGGSTSARVGGDGVVRTTADSFAFGYFDSTTYWVDGIAFDSSGNLSTISHSSALRPDTSNLCYNIYDYKNGYLMGWPATTTSFDATCFASAWSPSAGFTTNTANKSTLPVFANVGPRIGVQGGDATMIWGNQSSGTYSSYWDGASWTMSSSAVNPAFPFDTATNGVNVEPGIQLWGDLGQANFGDFLTFGELGHNSTNFRLAYARTGATGGALSLIAGPTTIVGMDHANMRTSTGPVVALTANGIIGGARHSNGLYCGIVTVGATVFQAVNQMYAFATP